jgi:capsular exopolysaccharide synthesis family protein
MENQPLLDQPNPDLRRRDSLALRPRYSEALPHELLEEPGPGLLLEYWDILRRRKGTLLVMAFLGLLASILFTLPQTPVYRARASLEIQSLNENFLNMRDVNPTNEGASSTAESDLQTDVKILQSESVLERVIAKLNLAQRLSADRSHSRLAAWRKALGLAELRSDTTRENLLGLAADNLTVRTEPNTRLVEVLYNSTDPQLAADFVNTLAAEFTQQNLEARWKTTQQTGEWLTRQMDDVRIKLEKSEGELQSYASASGLLFTSEKDNVAEDKLRQLQVELSQAQADRAARQSRYELASTASPESLPEVLDDRTLAEYQVKLTDLRRQLAELSSSLTPAHPAVKKVQAQITTLESALEKERTNVVQRIQNEYQAARRRENLIASNYAAQARLISEQAEKVAHYNILKREVDTNRQLYDSLLRNVQEADVTSALRASNVRVVDAAQPPTRPYKPNLLLNSALGLLAGALFGVGFVLAHERADQSIQAPGEVALYLEMPELGVIPSANAEGSRRFDYYYDRHSLRDSKPKIERNTHAIQGLGLRAQDSGPVTGDGGLEAWDPGTGRGARSRQLELVISQRKFSALADSFRATLTSILYSGENGDRPRLIVLTSANPREGKTTLSSNLALAAAEIGQSVLLIDGDLRKGRLHEIFRVSNARGLSDLLAGKEPPEDKESRVEGQGLAVATDYANLWLLPSGSPASNISGLLYSARAPELLRRLRHEFQMVIVDSPPMLNMPDARVLGRMADGVVLVVRSAQTTREAAVAAAKRLTDDGTRVLGAILNEWDPRKTSQFDYTYRYRYYP